MAKVSIVPETVFHRCERGAIAIEFALIGPLLIAIFLGCFISFDAVRGARQTSTAASVLSDLSTRVLEMNDASRDAFWLTGGAIMGKFASSNNPVMSVTSVVNVLGDGSNDLSVRWSHSNVAGNQLTTPDLANFDIPTIPEGESVILVIVRTTIVAPFRVAGFPRPVVIERIAVRRPRFVTEVPYV
jgi:Flp pilus assembly protein TadG